METAARWAAGGEVTLSQVHRFLRLEAGPDGLPVTVPDTGWAQVCQQLREGAEPAGAAQALLERGAVSCTRAGKRRWRPWPPRRPGRRAGRGRWR